MKVKMIFCYKIWLFIDIKNQNKVIIFFLIDSLFYMFLEKRFINSVRISSWILRNGRCKSFTSCPRIYQCRKRKHRRKLQFPHVRFVFSYLVQVALEPGATRSGRSVTPRTGPATKTITFCEERERGKTKSSRGLPTGPLAWIVKMPRCIAEYGRKHLSAPGNKTPRRETLYREVWDLSDPKDYFQLIYLDRIKFFFAYC